MSEQQAKWIALTWVMLADCRGLALTSPLTSHQPAKSKSLGTNLRSFRSQRAHFFYVCFQWFGTEPSMFDIETNAKLLNKVVVARVCAALLAADDWKIAFTASITMLSVMSTNCFSAKQVSTQFHAFSFLSSPSSSCLTPFSDVLCVAQEKRVKMKSFSETIQFEPKHL